MTRNEKALSELGATKLDDEVEYRYALIQAILLVAIALESLENQLPMAGKGF